MQFSHRSEAIVSGGSITGLGFTVASAYATEAELDAADFVCDGTADDVQINEAIEEIASRAPAQGLGSGLVQLVGPRFNTTSPIEMQSFVDLGGWNWYGTEIKAAAAFTGDGVIVLTDVNTELTRLKDLRIHGNDAAVAGTVHGVAYDNTAGSFSYAGPNHAINNVYIYSCDGDGLHHGTNCRGLHAVDVHVVDCNGAGIYVDGPDSFFVNCDAGSSGTYGFDLQGSNNRFTSCKSWFSDLSGWNLDSPRNQLATCEAQDNANHGFLIQDGQNSLAACHADSNSWETANANENDYDGFHIATTSSRINLQACMAYDKNEGSRGFAQRYGVNWATTIKYSVIDVICHQNITGSWAGNTSGAGLSVHVTGLLSDGVTEDTLTLNATTV